MYAYALLDPRNTGQAATANDAVFAGGPVYGLEVTREDLAARCVANLDPQHVGGDASTAAIEAALTAPLPPEGATLATVRADADALGAMAVLTLRADGAIVTGPMLARLAQIAEADKEAAGPWRGLSSNRTASNDKEPGGPGLASLAVLMRVDSGGARIL